MEGLWYTHFSAGPAHGDGMAVLHDGEILGGDKLHTYVGTYHMDGSLLYAHVRVNPFAAAVEANEQPVSLFLRGTINGDTAVISGHPDDQQEVSVSVEMHRAA